MQRAVAPRPATTRPGIRAARLVPVALAAVTVMAFLPVLGTVGVVDGARRFHAPATLAQYFEGVARHKPDAPVPRLGLVRAWRALGERERARAELEVLGRLHPGLVSAVVAGGEPS